MKRGKVESLGQLIVANMEKRKAAEAKRAELKKIDLNIMAAEGLEKRAAKKRKTAKGLYDKLGKLDYGNWVSDVLWPLADELARRTGKKASILGPSGIGAKITVILADEERDPEWYMKERLELTMEADFDDNGLLLRYETGDVSDRYAPGTVGHVNGLNNITAPLPDSVEEILGLFRAYPAITNNDEGGKEDG